MTDWADPLLTVVSLLTIHKALTLKDKELPSPVVNYAPIHQVPKTARPNNFPSDRSFTFISMITQESLIKSLVSPSVSNNSTTSEISLKTSTLLKTSSYNNLKTLLSTTYPKLKPIPSSPSVPLSLSRSLLSSQSVPLPSKLFSKISPRKTESKVVPLTKNQTL